VTYYGPIRIRRRRAAALLVGLAAVLAALLAAARDARPTASDAPPRAVAPLHGERDDATSADAATSADDGDDDRGALGVAGGAVPDGTTPFDDGVPGVARLDPELLRALRRAADDAGPAGVTLVVNSGWRSPAYEDQLRQEAIARYGSEQEAARWVATGTTSPHVRGEAVDVGPTRAAAWLGEHGAAYGLCRIYANEPWHFELRPQAIAAGGCPSMYPDPTHDPRMQP
jgi:zinc D-Ala-D-Ala carboxypeptidase